MNPGDIASYLEMCTREGVSLQRGMNFRLGPDHSVLLMSVREGAPYEDQTIDAGRTLIYEGHDEPQTKETPDPKLVDQPLFTRNGTPTQNGLFFRAAEVFRNGAAPPEKVRVYEKIRSGIWAYTGLFLLTDAWMEDQKGRQVCKFRLELADVDEGDKEGTAETKPLEHTEPVRVHRRLFGLSPASSAGLF